MGVKLLRGTDAPGVEEFPREDETSGVTLEGNGVPGADVQGQGGDGNSFSAWDAKGTTATCRGEEMESKMNPGAPPITPQRMAEGESDRITMVSMQRHSDGANCARPKHSALVHRKYGLLAPEGPAGDPAATGTKGDGENPENTTWTRGTNRR